ncbi:hypothetical protein ACUN0C_01065 [Faunimonas sp. B44]|uniref:hypothetical protein n=1 Tax=Faunimonas sp. B44 TaxID=3461493 RepID=UPI00404479F9
MAAFVNRPLHSVQVLALDPFHDEHGYLVSARVQISLTAIDGIGAGPGIHVGLALPVSEPMPIQDVQREAIRRALALVQRIARESPEALIEASAKPLDFAPEAP